MRASSMAIAWAVCVAYTLLLRVFVNSETLIAMEAPNTIPALPVAQQHKKKCQLDLSYELFGGVKEACGQEKTLDRSRCCPVLAAWLFAAYARTALQSAAPPISSATDDKPAIPDDSQTCVNALQDSLHSRGINIPRPNSTCDAIICFCGIRLHQLSSLTCASIFNHSENNATKPTISPVRALESNCTDSSYQGCTKCLKTLDKLKGKKEGYSDQRRSIYGRDCELMGLTWLLAKNKTAYIPTVSAVIRALMYSTHSPRHSECSPDQQNMPLAVDSVQLYQSSSAFSISVSGFVVFHSTGILMLLFLLRF